MVPTSAAVLSVLLLSLPDEAEELVAGEDEVCVAESSALLFVVVGELLLLPLPLPVPVLVEGGLVVVGSTAPEEAVELGEEADVPGTSQISISICLPFPSTFIRS